MKAFKNKPKPRDPFFGMFPHKEDDQMRPKIDSQGLPADPLDAEENAWAATVRRLGCRRRPWR